ncbi:hypothetical protein GC207_15275 [bacterium]|nr:hypothetical protein [bacterium]
MASSGTHTWNFFRAGGFDQVQFKSGADLQNLDQLDQKLWAALACPTRGLEFDLKTLDMIDTDKDGRIRSPEVLAAVKWACAQLKDPSQLLSGSAALPLSAINDELAEGKQLLASAKQILKNLGKADAQEIGVDDVADTAKIFAQTQFNGDGIVPADSATDDATKAIINDIIACLGADADRSGKPGISQAKLDAFFADARAFAEWQAKAEAEAATIKPLGDATAGAHAAFAAVRAKVNDFFARCRLAAFDSRALSALNRQESEYLTVAAKDMSITASEVADFPLARIESGRLLPLQSGINPAWAGALSAFAGQVVKPLLGDKALLSPEEWSTICTRLAPYESWLAAKAGASVEKLGLPRVKEILAGTTQPAIGELIAQDKALEAESNAIAAVEKLVRFNRDLITLLNNFVNFREFYSKDGWATFQAGTLYLDGRECELCVPVADAGKHAALAGMAKTYLAYCDCTRPGSPKMTIAAAFTGGDSDNLMVGRNGVFYDRKGQDWDATITKVIDNPISIRQAFWAPYKKLVRLIEEQVAKRAAAADAAADKKLAAAASSAANVDKAKPAEPKKVDVGTVAALGVAVGAIGTFLTTLIGYAMGLFALHFWMIVLAFCGILLVISGPSMLIAWLKLRQRNLGPILDANGWAINGRVKMNVPFGGSLTEVAKLPAGARASMDDPFAEKPIVWPKFVLFLVIVGFVVSLANQLLPTQMYEWTGGFLGKTKETLAKEAEAEKEAQAAANSPTNSPTAAPAAK